MAEIRRMAVSMPGRAGGGGTAYDPAMRRLRLLVLTLGLAVSTPAFAQDDTLSPPTKANGTTVDDAPPPDDDEETVW